MSVCPECSAPVRSDGNCGACLLRLASTYRHNHLPDDLAEIPESLRAHFPQFEILRIVGRGGMGVIYQARQKSLERDVAIKVIDRTISNDTSFLDRFDREAKALARLSHPNIVAVHDYGRTSDGLAYLTMEYVHGLNLREALQSMAIDTDYALEIIDAVSQSLEYAHSKGVVHRDIKPENILLSDDGRIKLADFGIAKINDATLPERKITATNQVLGTAHYLAPEQLSQRSEVDHRVDIYALGVILYELLTGHLPVGSFEPASRVNLQVTPEIDAVLMRALQQRPTARFQSVDEFRVALLSCRTTSGASTLVARSMPLNTQTTIAAVPFFCPGYKGWSTVHGTVRAQDDGVRIEYQGRDNFIGQIRSKLRAATIPWDRLVRIDLRPGFVHGVLQVNGDSFSLLENMPGSENGCMLLKIKRENLELAQQVIQRIAACQPHLVRTSSALKQWQGPPIIALPVMLITLAFLNIAFVAIVETAIATSTMAQNHKALGAIFFGVSITPIWIAQLVMGILYASTRSRVAGQVGALVSMIPVTPLALFSIPFGVWARKQLQPPHESPRIQSRGGGWGLTTVFFTAESKYARVASIVESAFCVVVLGGVGVWMLGFYPVTLNYRVVGQASDSSLDQFLTARLQDVPTVSIKQTTSRLQVTVLQRHRQDVVDRLALTQSPALVICANKAVQDKEGTQNYLPSVSQQVPSSVLTRTSGSGVELAVQSEVALDEDWLSSVQTSHLDALDITWSREGSMKIRELLNDQDAHPVMALKIDGFIEAITDNPSSDVQPTKSATFHWLNPSKRSIGSLKAALRGPSLDTEFELID